MPSITIREIDNTTAGSDVLTEDVVYVPGFINKAYILTDDDGNAYSECADAFTPVLCETVAEFEANFGKVPATFVNSQTYSSITGFESVAVPKSSDIMYLANTMDPGYVYAKELLTAGIPVLYERVNNTADGSDINIAYMYNILAERTDNHIWENLKDNGEYIEVKYLTSGGYPVFEYFDSNLVCTSSEFQLIDTELKFDQAKFKKKVTQPTLDTSYEFRYAVYRENATEVDTDTELQAYLPKATIDEYCYVRATGKLYKKSVVGETIDWVLEENWASWYLYDTETSAYKSITLSDYGITITATYEYPAGTTIYVNWPVNKCSTIVAKMLSCAASRGDCVALIDHTNNFERSLDSNSSKSVYYSISNTNSEFKISTNGEFGAMFTPWCTTSFAATLTNTAFAKGTVPSAMPGSFFYLKALAKSIQSNANWLAIAGAARGVVDIGRPYLTGTLRLSNTIADSYEPDDGIAINPITNVKPYGYLIWGNRTLKNNATEGGLTATSFLNLRNMVSDIKKTAYSAAKKCLFEQNSDVLWINYKAMITPLLDNMVSGNGLAGYKLIQGTTSEKAKLVCTIRLYPIYAVEKFDITVELADDEVTIS